MNQSAIDYSSEFIQTILQEVKTIAMVGASNKANRPSYQVMQYLLEAGYEVIPVNPMLKDQLIIDQECYPSLIAISKPIDMVEIFRSSERALGVVEEAIQIKPKVIWMQLEVINHQAATLAEQSGIKVVMDRCPVIELERLKRLKQLKQSKQSKQLN